MGYLPSSAPVAAFALCYVLPNIVYRIVKGVFSIGELSQNLKSDLTKVPQTSILQVKISEVMESQILHASEGFGLLKLVCRLKLKRAWKAFCCKWSSESVKFPEDEMQVPQ